MQPTIQNHSPKKDSTRKDLMERVLKARQYIHTNIESAIDIKSLAGTACLSEYHFIRIFNEFVGMTPYQYILQKRIIRAKELLVSGNYSMKEIAHKCGFETVQTFRKCFKRIEQVSPSEYIRRQAA